MTPVFADTFYLVGLVNPDDEHHELVRRFSRQFRRRILSTAWVLTEVADALRSPPNRPLAAKLRELATTSPFIRIVPASEEFFHAGFDLYEARPDKHWSLTDCISFVVMTERGLTEALTGDHHFEQAGFRALLRG